MPSRGAGGPGSEARSLSRNPEPNSLMLDPSGLGHVFLLGMLAWVLLSGSVVGGDAVDYPRHVKPILKQRCYSCHGALKQKDGLRLDTGTSIRRGGKSGPV